MPKEYILKQSTFGQCPILPIDSQKFLRIKDSRQILLESMATEEEYEMVIRNIVELEKESVSASVLSMVRDYRSHLDFFDARLALNIRFMNLLTSVRLYIDRLLPHCRVCSHNSSDVEEELKILIHAIYDKNFDYRFMEELRNHVQHHGAPVHLMSYGSRWTSLDDKGLMEYALRLFAEKSILALDRKFNKNILNEMPGKVELISSSRGYIEALSLIHVSLRQMISSSVGDARAVIQRALNDYKAISNKDVIGLVACVYDGNTKIEEVPILLIWDDIRIQLEKRNHQLINYKKRYPKG
jgi:hypothetical protein